MFTQWHLLITLVLFLFTTQCQWKQPLPKNTLYVAIDSSPKTLDPRYATDANGQRIGQLIFSSLVKLDDDLNVIGDAASSWTLHGNTYNFDLKPNIQFHDGSALTPEDILFSFNTFRAKDSPFAATMNIIQSISAEYGEQGGFIKLKLRQYSASFLKDLSVVKLLPKSKVQKLKMDFFKNLTGTGPFKVARIKNNEIYLSRNDNYHSEKARSKHIHFKVIKDANTRFLKLYKGKIDIIQSDIPFSKVRVFKNNKDFQVVINPGLSMTYLLLNLKDPLLKQTSFRKSLFHGINRDDIIQYSFAGLADKASAIISPAHPFFNKNLTNPPLDEKSIRHFLTQAPKHQITLKTSNQMSSIEKGKILSHQLKKMGLHLNLQSYEWGTFYGDVRKGNFQMALMKWVGITDPDIYRISLHSSMFPPGRNRGYYSNKAFDHLVEEAHKERDINKRKVLYHKIQQVIFEDLPTIPLWYEKQIAIIHKRVKNYNLPLTGDFSSLTKAYKD